MCTGVKTNEDFHKASERLLVFADHTLMYLFCMLVIIGILPATYVSGLQLNMLNEHRSWSFWQSGVFQTSDLWGLIAQSQRISFIFRLTILY